MVQRKTVYHKEWSRGEAIVTQKGRKTYTWTDIGANSLSNVINAMTTGLGKSCIEGAISKYWQIEKVEYIGNTAKGRPVMALTEISGNPYGYVVVDPVYNYFAVYNMDCAFLAEGCITFDD